MDWHLGTWESIGYACDGPGEPDVECNVTRPLEYEALVIQNLEHDRVTMDYVWLFAEVGAPSPGDSIDAPGFLGSGHGVMVEQLNSPPPGLDIGGEAWVRLTVSSLSAMDYAQTSGKLAPTEIGYTLVPWTPGDAIAPVSEFPPPELGEARWIETVVLVATNDTMSQWIISFNQPGTYAYTADYGAMGGASPGDLVVGFVPA